MGGDGFGLAEVVVSCPDVALTSGGDCGDEQERATQCEYVQPAALHVALEFLDAMAGNGFCAFGLVVGE
nr:hypothetical protein [Kibdelosporangium sp. MJ126-NF4]CTQ88279.1 hypothetical protein [Kibdelosporangium sp. MJ126-NF4]